jgi:hypothetical protein
MRVREILMGKICSAYVKGVGSSGVGSGAVGIVVLDEEELEFSYVVEGLSLHNRELNGIDFVLDELRAKGKRDVSFFLNNMGAVTQLNADWTLKYKDFFKPMTNKIKPKEDYFDSVSYEFVGKKDEGYEHILRGKGLAELTLGKS